MPLTLATTDISISGITYSATVPTPFPSPAPTTATYNSTYAGGVTRVRGFDLANFGASINLEIPVPTLVDNQSYPGIPSGVVAGGDAGIRLPMYINNTGQSTRATSTPYIMQVYTDSPASNTFPLSVGLKSNPGGPTTVYTGGVAIRGFSTMESTSLGSTSTPSGSFTLSLGRQSPAPLGTTASTMINIDAGAPGTTSYYLRFVQSGAERGTIYSPGSTTTYATSSDYRLKDNITPLDPQEELQRVNDLRPRKWNWKNSQDPGVGFIAHELQETFEDANKLGMVSGSKDSVTRKGRICDIVTGEPCYKETKIDETTGDEIITYIYMEEPNDEEKIKLAADGSEWVHSHDEPAYQGIDTSFLASSTVAAIQALTNKVVALESRVAALESM